MSTLAGWLTDEAASLIKENTSRAVPNEGLAMGEPIHERVQRSIERRLNRNEFYFRVVFVMSAALAVLTIAAPFIPVLAKTGVVAAFGVTTAAAIAATVALYKEKNAFDMMLVVAMGLGEDDLRNVLDVLIKKHGG